MRIVTDFKKKIWVARGIKHVSIMLKDQNISGVNKEFGSA